MAFPSISEFKERLIDGGSRPSLFRMEVTWPSALGLENLLGAPLLPFMCRMSDIPASTLSQVTTKFVGREVKLAGQRSYSNQNITVINDGAYQIRRAFEGWHDAINSRETNVARLTAPSGARNSYAGTGRVVQYGLDGNETRSYVFVDMWPVNIGQMQLDWGSDSSLGEFTVEFAYQYWVPGEAYAGSALQSALGR